MRTTLSKILGITILSAILSSTNLLWSGIPVSLPPSGTSWTVIYSDQNPSPQPQTPEQAEALRLLQTWQPRLLRSTSFRIGDHYLRIDEYTNGRKLQTYATPKFFIEELFSGEQIVAVSRAIDEILESDRALVFFPELRGFENAQSLGVASTGKEKGLLKFVLRTRSNADLEDAGVREYLAQQGVEYQPERSVEEYLLVDPKTNLPVEYRVGGVIKTYKYKPVSVLPPISPVILNYIEFLKKSGTIS